MPRPKQSIERARLTGDLQKNPQRYRAQAQAPRSDAAVGEPPPCMTAAAQACWREIASQAHPDTLTGADRALLEVVSALLAEFRSAPADFTAARHGMMLRGLSALGMTPVDRGRLSPAPRVDDENNPFAEFA